MRAFDVPVLHASRTRGRSETPRAQAKSNPFMVRIGGPNDDPETTQLLNGANLVKVPKNRRIWCCDCVSGYISFVAIFIGIGMGIHYENYGQTWHFWDQNVLVSKTTDMDWTRSLTNFTHGVQNYCTKDGTATRTVYALERVWNEHDYIGTAIIEKAGDNNAGAITQIMPWLVLTFIFVFSTCFQCTRLRVTETDVEESDSNTEWIQTRQKYRKEGYILSEGWKFFKLGDVFKFINDQSYEYDPRKKDFWRWLEYALTSPLQITLIAMFIFVLDRSTIMNLWGLQGALVLLGALNEYYIDKVWKAIIKGRKSDGTQLITFKNNRGKLVILSIFCWLAHYIIWWTVLSRYHRQVSNQSSCKFTDKMPDWVTFIVWSQFVFFTLFGVVQLVQVVYTLRTCNKSNTDDNTTLERKRRQCWQYVAFAYSVLSVVAKSLLEIGFIGQVAAISQTISKS